MQPEWQSFCLNLLSPHPSTQVNLKKKHVFELFYQFMTKACNIYQVIFINQGNSGLHVHVTRIQTSALDIALPDF